MGPDVRFSKDFKVAVITMVKELKDISSVSEHFCNLNRQIEIINENQLEIPELKITIRETKIY